ncbi:MAG: CoA transferase [Deltaproteobacteria bacterium]|nr:MAG: CoA transferase [Deltaproteobacteria bacterium]
MEGEKIFADITVLSLEQATVLPYLTYRLAQDGATVIRIEHPVYGDPNRKVGEDRLGDPMLRTYFLPINAGKKAITLNLGVPEGRELFYQLIRKLDADIFCTNQLPRNYQKLGIDYETLRGVKEDIIWFGVTGFGPESNEAAYDPILQARGGLMELTGEPDGPPMVLGIPLPDMGSSEHGYGLIMKALFVRERTGKGTRIDLAMFESTVSWLTVPITLTESFGRKITRRGNTHEFFAPVSVYETRDGYVYIAVGNDRQWEDMTTIPGFEHLRKEEYKTNAGRIADVKNLNRMINEVTKTYSTEELIKHFNERTIPISKINTIKEVVKDPLIKRRLLFSKDPVTGTEITLAPPPYMTPYLEERGRTLPFPPRFGEHNEEIYGEVLGLSSSKIKELKEKGII